MRLRLVGWRWQDEVVGWRVRSFLVVAVCTAAVAAALGSDAATALVLLPWAALVVVTLWLAGPQALTPNRASTAELAGRRLLGHR